MIASDYLDFRARLNATISSLAEALRRSGAEVGKPAVLRNLMGALKDPLLAVVAGETGAGKSVFLNALAGEEFCEEGDRSVAFFKFGDHVRDVPGGDGLIERYRACDFLRGFQVVEMPGTEAATDAAVTAGERFVPIADLIVAVISVADAWTPGVWKSLDRVHVSHGREPLVVLSGCDLRTVDEIEAVVEHMELTMGKRYGRVLPIFQMSAEDAFLARTNPAAGGETKLTASGILEFEEFVSNQLLASDARMGKFENVLAAARASLDELAPSLDETEEILGKDGDLLGGLKSEINSRYEITNTRLRNAFFEELDGGYAAAVESAQAELKSSGGWFSIPRQVLRGGQRSLPAGLDERFCERVVVATESKVIEAMTGAENDVNELWEQLSARVAEGFEHRLSASDGTGKAVWSGRGEGLLRRAEACAKKACADFSIETAAGEQLRHGGFSMRFFAIASILLGAGAGVLYSMQLAPYHLFVGGLALLAIGFGAGQFIDGRRKLRKVVAARAEAGRIQLRADLSNELTSHIHEYYTRLGSIFDPVQELCQKQLAEVEPQIAEVRKLDDEVVVLTDELAAMRKDAIEKIRRLELQR